MNTTSLVLKTTPLIILSKPAPQELIADNFTFDDDITRVQVGMLRERHRFAYANIMSCQDLDDDERKKLRQTYRRKIRHSSLDEPDVNARAKINGSRIWINFDILFPQGSVEIAQTLIHEMMHCAGFTHPKRRDPPKGKGCAKPEPDLFDCPFDNGQYIFVNLRIFPVGIFQI